MGDLAKTLTEVRAAPGLFALHGAEHSTRYRTLVAFVEGIDIGTSRTFLADFHRWFRQRHSLPAASSLSWDGEIVWQYLPGFKDRKADYPELTDEENDFLVSAALGELILYASEHDL